MKSLITVSVRVLILLCVGALGWLGYEQYKGDTSVSAKVIADLNDRAEELLYQKTIKLSGLKLLSELDIERYLPHEKSVPWWVFNSSKIESEIETHSLIADTKIETCSWWTLSCFSISVDERMPTFVALSDKNAWVVADDGAFITPIPRARVEKAMFKRPDETYVKPPVVEGLFNDDKSPEVSRARSVYVNQAIELIETKTGRSIDSVSIRPNGELEVQLRDTSYVVLFDKSYGEQEKLEDQLERFAKILEQFAGKERTIDSIDLAFNSLAVVRLKNSEKSAT